MSDNPNPYNDDLYLEAANDDGAVRDWVNRLWEAGADVGDIEALFENILIDHASAPVEHKGGGRKPTKD